MVRSAEQKPQTAFDGPHSLRLAGEWRVLVWSLVAIVVAAPFIGFAFPILASLKEIALLLIGAMIYVTFARGRLIGGSIRVHPGQFGHVHEIALECARALRMTMPNVFVRDDPFVPMIAVGIGEPYSLIISAQWVDHLTPGELRFLIGRELAHIEAGHTRITSLLSVNGRENAIISILFGAWLRRIEYTADRAGLLCCRSLDDALSAISISTFHLVGRKIDMRAFAEQQRELEAERSLRIGEWISSTPYATKRIASLHAFARSGLYLTWSARFEQSRYAPFAPIPVPTGAVSRRALASFPRRCAAIVVDAVVVAAIVPKLPVSFALDSSARLAADGDAAWLVDLIRHHPTIFHSLAIVGSGGLIVLWLYIVVLVGIAGQTLGMMIMDLRVVTDRFGRIGLTRSFVRYVCFVASIVAVVGIFRIFGRLQPFEKWSGTRLIDGAAYARKRERVTASPFEVATPS